MKKIAKILSVVLCMVMVLGLMATTTFAAGNQADLNTMAENTSYSGDKTSTAGWVAKNAQATNKQAVTNGEHCVILNGKTSAAGSLTSPTLAGGIKSLSFSYANAFSESNGVDVTISVTPAGGTAVTHRLDNNSVTTGTEYTCTWVLDTPVEGDFTITIKNNSPSNNSSKNKDRVAIWNLTWIDTAAAACTHEESSWGTWQKDGTYHWKYCSCGDTTEFAKAEHSYTNYVCECGAIQMRDLPTDSKAIVDAAFSLDKGEALSKWYNYTGEITLTGVVTKDATWNDSYSNGTVYFDVEGTTETKNMQAYKLVAGADLTADDVKGLAVGDTVTISGSVIKNYNGTIEFDGSKLLAVTKASTGEDDEDDQVTPPPAGGTGNIEGIAPVNGATIKLGLWQNGMGKFLYFNGEVANKYYLGTTEDYAASVNLTVEQVEGGWLLWFMKDGVKTYVTIVPGSGTHVNAVMTTDVPTPFAWNTTYKTFTLNVNGEDYFIGTYTKSDGTDYSTLSASKLSYLSGDSNYPCHLYTEQPAKTGDISSVFVALLAVSAIGAGALISKKGKFVA